MFVRKNFFDPFFMSRKNVYVLKKNFHHQTAFFVVVF
jgi:hypothetical protein